MVDDPQCWWFSRDLLRPHDAIGAEGRIDGVRYLVSGILQLGANVVVYGLRSPEKSEVLVYGFGRDAVDAVRAWTQYLQFVTRHGMQMKPEQTISLADRALQVAPNESSIHYNKGVALLAIDQPEAAHACFEATIANVDADLLTLLYDAAALAKGRRTHGCGGPRSAGRAGRRRRRGARPFRPAPRRHRSAIQAPPQEPSRTHIRNLCDKYFKDVRAS